MPDNIEHAIAGGIVGLTCYLGNSNLTKNKPSLIGVLVASTLGGIAGLLPDIIEPPNNPNHRGLFHSASVGGLLTYLLKDVAKSNTIRQEGKLISAIFGLGYLSHLFMDSSTKKGLPII